MPNHIHGLIEFDKMFNQRIGRDAIYRVCDQQQDVCDQQQGCQDIEQQNDHDSKCQGVPKDAINRVSTTAVMKNSENSINKPIDKTGGITGQNNPMLNENLSPYSYFYKNAPFAYGKKICYIYYRINYRINAVIKKKTCLGVL